MKQILTIVIGLLFSIPAFAVCENLGLWVFPRGQTIKQNSIFVIEGYQSSQKVILELNKKYKIYLKSGNKKIKLLVTETCVGQYQLTQALLRPEKELEAGLEYTFCIDNLPKYETIINNYNSITHKYEHLTYKVLAGKDNDKPQLATKPKELKKIFVRYGCGPDNYVVFSNPAKDSSEILVRTTVKDLKTRKETTYYLQPQNGKIYVGRDMCSGQFVFEEQSKDYEVEFSFMDASGNLTAWEGERIKFTKPIEQTWEEG